MADTTTAPTTTAPTTTALDTTTLVTQLRALGQLTQTEVHIARLRVAQARTDAVRRELQENADNGVRRGRRIADALRALDAVPDVVTPVIGRFIALVKGTVEQAQPIDEALLGDLTLEHQLLDRARYVRVLAERAERADVRSLADDLVTAHTATVDWLTTVLAEEALGGPSALVPTPLQRVAGGVTRVVGLPTRFATRQVNRAMHTVYRTGEAARGTAEEVAGKVVHLGADAREVAAAGRDATLARAERVAQRDGADDVADAVHKSRSRLGGLTPAELPIMGWDKLAAPDAIAAARELTQPDDLTAVLEFEEANENRAGVVSAIQARYAAVAKDSGGSEV